MTAKKKTSAKKKTKAEWTLKDFVRSVDRTMQSQAKKFPSVQETHDKLSGRSTGPFKRIGLTGSFGSGKSTVAWILQELGVSVINTDDLAHDVIAPHTKAWKQIFEHFGEQILLTDGIIDRKQLANIVFNDERERKVLEGIVHPHVKDEVLKCEAELRKKTIPYCLIEVPLLFEAHWQDMVDLIVVVSATHEQIIERVQGKYGLTAEDIELRLNSQWPLQKKIELADVVIDNSGPLEETRVQVERLYRKWERGEFK
ncbi:MAG: dephospho-CoA kinase [Deltaproteobacteria bacterium]|nr:dephospho-CoA kinase [Deltaproteobacteria bacterium]